MPLTTRYFDSSIFLIVPITRSAPFQFFGAIPSTWGAIFMDEPMVMGAPSYGRRIVSQEIFGQGVAYRDLCLIDLLLKAL